MRSQTVALMLLSVLMTRPCAADATPPRKIQKVALLNLAWDSARATAVELGTKENLVKKGVYAASVRSLIFGETKPANAKDLAALLKAKGFDSLLCVGVYRTMQLVPIDDTNDFPTLESCLSIFLTGKYASGASLRSEPFVIDAEPTTNTNMGGELRTSRTPIPTNSGAVSVTYYKRTLRVFDVPSETLLWEKRIMVKLPRDLQDSAQASWIARETAKTLETSGLLP